MALRSLLRKMPALGLRSPPTGPPMGPFRALSPAAGYRPMSHGGAGVQRIYSEEMLAREQQAQEEIKRMKAQFQQNHLSLSKDLSEFSKRLRCDSVEDAAKFNKNLDAIEMTCNAAMLVGVPAIIFMIINF